MYVAVGPSDGGATPAVLYRAPDFPELSSAYEPYDHEDVEEHLPAW